MQKVGFSKARMATTFNSCARKSYLVLRGEQLPDGPGALPLRPALLERRFHPHAGAHAQLLPAPDVPAERPGEAGHDRARRGEAGPAEDQASHLHPVHARGPHRAVEIDLPRDADLQGADPLRARRLRPYRRRRQPARCRQVQPLGHEELRPTGSLVPGRDELAGSWWPDWHRGCRPRQDHRRPHPGRGAAAAIDGRPAAM